MTKDTKDTKKTRADDHEPARHGDVLGITDADPNVEIPRATEDLASGSGHLKQTSGATAIDMGAGGHGTGVKPGS